MLPAPRARGCSRGARPGACSPESGAAAASCRKSDLSGRDGYRTVPQQLGSPNFCTSAPVRRRMRENQRMHVTAKADYAVRAVVELADSAQDSPRKVDEVAQAQKIPV